MQGLGCSLSVHFKADLAETTGGRTPAWCPGKPLRASIEIFGRAAEKQALQIAPDKTFEDATLNPKPRKIPMILR